MFAKELRAGAERSVEANKKTRVGADVDNDAMMQEIGAVEFTESDLKYDEAVEKFRSKLCEEMFGEHYDAASGEALDGELSVRGGST